MKLFTVAVIATTVTLAGCPAGPDCACVAVTDWEARLSGANVIPPVTTTASGTAQFHYGPSGRSLDYTVRVTDLPTAASAQLFVGTSLVNGAAVLTFCSPCVATAGRLAAGTIQLSRQMADSLLLHIRAFGTYLEIRTDTAAILRGQLRIVAP